MSDDYLATIIKPGDMASRLAKQVCFQSHGNNKAVYIVPHQPGNFRGAVDYVWRKHVLRQMLSYEVDSTDNVTSWTMAEHVQNDGAGGKPQFFSLVGTPEVFHGLGWEVIVMAADDFARTGRYPVIIDNEVNAKQVTDGNFHLFQAMMTGYGEALSTARLINITRETAIMPHCITAFCDVNSDEQLILTWGASCIGLAHRELHIDGSSVKPGMTVIGFWEPGYRCNGGTFFTKLIQWKWGPDPRDVLQNGNARQFAKALTVPSLSYAKTVTRLIGWEADGRIGRPKATIHGIAHITGGGHLGQIS